MNDVIVIKWNDIQIDVTNIPNYILFVDTSNSLNIVSKTTLNMLRLSYYDKLGIFQLKDKDGNFITNIPNDNKGENIDKFLYQILH